MKSHTYKLKVFLKNGSSFGKGLRYVIYLGLKLYSLTIGWLLYNFSKQYARYHTRLLHIMDWGFALESPSNYRHEINLYNWRYNPEEVEFVEVVFGRMLMRKNDVVLDLCCGDGSYSYLFYSDIAKRVDSIDYDFGSIAYAKKNYFRSNIQHICGDVLQHSYPLGEYDLIVWTSGVAYFSITERGLILDKLFLALKDKGKLYIRTPLEENVTTSANQKSVIVNEQKFEKELQKFNIITSQKTFYNRRTNLNYVLTKKENPY